MSDRRAYINALGSAVPGHDVHDIFLAWAEGRITDPRRRRLFGRMAGIPTWASSGIFIKPDEMFAHGLNERIPVASFYAGIEHIHDLAMALGDVR